MEKNNDYTYIACRESADNIDELSESVLRQKTLLSEANGNLIKKACDEDVYGSLAEFCFDLESDFGKISFEMKQISEDLRELSRRVIKTD